MSKCWLFLDWPSVQVLRYCVLQKESKPVIFAVSSCFPGLCRLFSSNRQYLGFASVNDDISYWWLYMPVAIIYIPNVGEKYIPSLSISRRHLDFLHSTDYRYNFKNQIVFVVMQLYGEISPPTVRVLLKLKTGEGVKALSKIPNQHCCIRLRCVIIDFDTHFLILLDSIHESGTEHFLSQNEREQCPQAFCSQRGSEKHWNYSVTTTQLHSAFCETRERTVQKRREGCVIHWAQQSKLQVRFFQSSCTSQMKWPRHFWAKGKAPEADTIFWFTIGIS